VEISEAPGYGEAPLNPITIDRMVIEGMEDLDALDNTVYYPHVDSDILWETEICIINEVLMKIWMGLSRHSTTPESRFPVSLP
jgi:hypothetical protein